ncbi:glycosyl transferase family 2 [Paractinoplanes deccanensis]|uniref:Glycosyl transferase family 2 n=1 Tax=Paractinoplanes deccanensis TaxID=113561 RepID=A0ABQ3XXE0_9ACTN|nr:glycosyltransferase [Actinoplanes deccanensis]GID72396.1 glycosyl transferase family 2 [Actinoplanes deccanensis]
MTASPGPDATVVIPTHTERRWESLRRTVASALAQDLKPAEVIVVADHNPGLFERATRAFPGVTVLENTAIRGASGNRNTGAFHARSELIAFLDDDTVAHPGWLGHLASAFTDPGVVGAGGSIRPAWQRRRPRWMPDELLWTVGVSYAGMPTTATEIRNVWSASMMVRRGAFLAVGGFRAGFGKLGDRNRPEDTELCLRISAETGGRWMYVPASVIEHDVPVDRSTFRFFLRRCYAEGRGKVQMSALLPRDRQLATEQDYLRRTLPRAVARDIVAASRGHGGFHALRAATVVAAVVAAGFGGGVEMLAGIGN